MLRTARAPAAILLLGGLGLAAPPQTRDMLAFLGGDHAAAAVSFQIALLVLGGSAWFWSRAVLAARFGIDDRQRGGRAVSGGFDWTAFNWLPRFVLAATFLIGAAIAFRGRSPWTIAGAIAVGTLALLLAVVRPRAGIVTIPPAPRAGLYAWLRGGAWARFRTLMRRAPFGQLTALTLLALGLVPLALAILEAFTSALHFPNLVAAAFPGPASAVLLLGLMIGPLSVSTFVCDGLGLPRRLGPLPFPLRRPPVLSLILIYVFVAVPALFSVHTVRIAEHASTERQPLDVLFDAWAKKCAPGTGPVRPIIVAVSGGATRAGLWGAAVIDRVLRAQQSDGPALFAVSSVSGGSLGVAGALTLLSREDLPCRAKGLPLLRPAGNGHVPLAGDALGPLLAGWLIDDIPRSAFDPIAALVRAMSGRRPNGGDSAEAIEHGFEDLWAAIRPKGAPGWDQPFLSLFYVSPTGPYRGGMPLWFANGTDAGTGNRVITAPTAVPMDRQDHTTPWPFRGARDFHVLMGADVSIATAIDNTARFPYLEPFGQMLPLQGGKLVGSLVDGGYFENEGLQTALDLAGWLAAHPVQGRPVRPIIVQATGDGEAKVSGAEVMTCTNASDGPFIPDEHSAWQVFAPLLGLYHVRGGHSAVLLRQARDELCDQPGQPRFVHFYLPADHGSSVPLNWVLSDATARFIWGATPDGGAFNDQQVRNETELSNLAAALASEPR
ncbi:MAG TPA: hypothetical protein VH855_21755 [Acetobacteraceae bacterium]|jgi:hypothetical protein